MENTLLMLEAVTKALDMVKEARELLTVKLPEDEDANVVCGMCRLTASDFRWKLENLKGDLESRVAMLQGAKTA
jgi:hypothetical protein